MAVRDTPRILALGETLGVAVTPTGTPLRSAPYADLHTAGAESTVAIGLSRLGLVAGWLGVVGADEIGARVLRDLSAEGVDIGHARVDVTATTAFMLRELRTAELTRVTYYRTHSAGSRLTPDDVDAAFDGFRPDLVHLTGITPALSENACAAAEHAVRRARDAGIEVSLDVNHRPSLPGSGRAVDALRRLVPHCDVVFVGDDELNVLTPETDHGRAAATLSALGVAEVVVKQGAAGALSHLADVTHRIEAMRVQVADVIGAGDSFVAGYLAARGYGLDVAERLRWGTVCAARTVGTHGDWEGLPSRAELDTGNGVIR